MYDIGYGSFTSIYNGTIGTVATPLAGTGAGSLGFGTTAIDGADAVHISVFGNDVNYRYDGGTATAGNGGGHAIAANSERILRGNHLIRNLSFISKGGSNVTINVTLLSR